MNTYKIDPTKRLVVGILLVMLTLGFCVVGTGAASADQMGGPGSQMAQGGPMGRGFGPGGQNGPTNQQGFGPGGQNGPDSQNFGPGGNSGSDAQDFDSFVPYDESSDGFGPRGGFGQDMGTDSDGQFSRDGGFGPGGQRDFGGHGGFGRDGGPQGMDNGVREAIDALEDADTKAELETLMDKVHTAMEALHNADDDTRDAAEADVKEARDALNSALEEAGIDTSMSKAPEKPENDSGMNRPELPDNGNQDRPDNSGMQNLPDFLNQENLHNIDLNDEEQVQDLFQQFLAWLQDSKT